MNDTKINLTDLTLSDVNIIIAGLGKLPLEASVDVWTKIKSQAEAQMKSEPTAE